MRDICGRILQLYDLPSVPLSKLLKQVQEARQALDALSSKGKLSIGESAAATPNLEPLSNFSPASKTGEDMEVPDGCRGSKNLCVLQVLQEQQDLYGGLIKLS